MSDAHTHLNRVVARARTDAEQHIPELQDAYTALLKKAGHGAADNFRRLVITAAVSPWNPPPDDLVDGDALETDAVNKLAPIHKRLLDAVTPAADLGIAFDLNHPASQALLAGVSKRLGTLGDAIRQQVNEAVAQGYAEGWSVSKTADEIVTKTDMIAPVRAEALARTDLNSLSNGSSLGLAQQVEGVTAKTWLATNDEKTRETHADADGQTVSIDQPFDVGGEQAQYPADPDLSDDEAFNCRCAVTYGDDLTASATPTEGGDMSTTDDHAIVPQELWDAVVDGVLSSQATRARALSRRDNGIYLTAAASGDTTLPLSARDRAWDAGEATGRVKKWASSDGSGDPSTIDYGKLGRAYFWKDGDGSAIGDFKFPFADIVNGTLTAVWKGVTAGAQRLSSAKGVDTGAVRKRMAVYYAKAASEFKDPTVKVPWSSEVETLSALREFDPALESVSDEALLTFHALILASRKQHGYRGDGGLCAICGMPPTDEDAHFNALAASASEFTIVAAAAPGEATRWVAPALLVENQPTEDGRVMMPGAISWRDMPLPLGLMVDTMHSDFSEAPVCGGIDTIVRVGDVLTAGGFFNDNLDDPDLVATALQAIELISNGSVRGISADVIPIRKELVFWPDDDQPMDVAGEDELPPELGEEMDVPPITDVAPDGDDGSAPAEIEVSGRMLKAVFEGMIGGACVVPTPAIANAQIIALTAAGFGCEILRVTNPLFADCGCDDLDVAVSLVAAAAPLAPPAEWFADPELEGPTPLTVTDDGRVFGHIALWNSCHEGFPGRCVPPPRSSGGYRKFHNGEFRTADGSRIAVGKLTLKAGHAAVRGVSEEQARAHYDNTATIGAFVRASDDEFGIRVAGALKSDLAPELVRDLMASPPSGDWRGGELVAAHAVIDPGFPVLRASGFGELLEWADDEGEPAEVSPLAHFRPGRKAVA